MEDSLHVESSGKIILQFHSILLLYLCLTVWIALLITLLQTFKVIFVAAAASVGEFLTHSLVSIEEVAWHRCKTGARV